MGKELDDLANIIHTAHCLEWVHNESCMFWDDDRESASAALAAGYRKPRTITTVEELDSLPAGTVIREPLICTKWGDGSWGTFSGGSYSSNRIDLPATVLWEPTP